MDAFKANANAFDLVISDMSMPTMAGDQLATEIRSIRSDIPIIICTGFSERMDEEKAMALGINGLLAKPFVKSEMATILRQVLDSHGGEQEDG